MSAALGGLIVSVLVIVVGAAIKVAFAQRDVERLTLIVERLFEESISERERLKACEKACETNAATLESLKGIGHWQRLVAIPWMEKIDRRLSLSRFPSAKLPVPDTEPEE